MADYAPLADSQPGREEAVLVRKPGAGPQHGKKGRRNSANLRLAHEFDPEDMLNEQQIEALDLLTGPQQHTLLVGGARSQKTFTLCFAIVMRAMLADGGRHAILRFRQNAVRQSVELDTLPRVMTLCFPRVKLIPHRMDSYYTMEHNGSEIWLAGLDEKERVEKILGMEFATIFLNECSQIPYASALTVRTRLAQRVIITHGANVGKVLPVRAYYDLNPVGTGHWTYKEFFEHVNPDTRLPLLNPDLYRYKHMTPARNRQNLPPGYIEDILEALPERQRKRYLEGIYVPEVEGAMWPLEVIERNRLVPDQNGQVQRGAMRRIVVAVDPSGAHGEEDKRSDEIGIVVVGLGVDGIGYVLADRSMKGPPELWGRAVIQAYIDSFADLVVAETNFGADMVRFVVEQAAKAKRVAVKFRKVTASRGKVVRAEPVSVLYEQDRVKHCGTFHILEDQMLNMATDGYKGSRSPDRLDALVWGVSELMVRHRAPWADQPRSTGGLPASIFGR